MNSRRRRPELFFQPPAEESWESISNRMRRKWWDERPVFCGICLKRIVFFRDLVPDHIEPGKMGGCKDNSEENLQPAHWQCNRAKGSQRNYQYPAWKPAEEQR